ncbi:MAG: GtrA family protein [Candidatus Dormibacteraceae bacterium]
MLGVDTVAVRRSSTARALVAQAGRFARFAAVGTSGVLVNNIVLFLLVDHARFNPVTAAVIATEAAVLSNFTLNDRWTFADMRGQRTWLGRAVHYNVVVLGGLLIAVITLFALTYWFHIHYLIANLAGIAAGMVWNYAVNLRVTWRKEAVAELPTELWRKAQ